MFSPPLEAKSCSPHAIIGNERRIATIETRTLTAVLTGLRIHHGGRRVGRLNAFVDGVGQRTVHVELDAVEYERAVLTLQQPGTLIRASGELVREGPRLLLLRTYGLQFLEPAADDDDP